MQRGFVPIPLIILLIFVVASGLSFYAGTQYSKSKVEAKIEYVQQKSLTAQVNEDLEERCGKLPSEAYPKPTGPAGLTDLSGPYLTPDCRYAVSLLNVRPMGFGPRMDVDIDKLLKSLNRGVYIYKDADKSIKLVYKLEGRGEVSSVEWVDRENFTFEVDSKKYNYNVEDDKVSSLN